MTMTLNMVWVVLLGIAFFAFYSYFSKKIQISINNDTDREKALDIIEAHGLRSYFYLPGVGIKDKELRKALCYMQHQNYVFIDESGKLLGKVAVARPTKDEIVEERRLSFKLIETE